MNNPKTLDRRDVSHPTNPIGGHNHIEETNANLAEPFGPKTAKLPAGDREAAATNVSLGAWNDHPDTGMPRNVPPARTGQSGQEVRAAVPDKGNPQRMDRAVRVDGRDTVNVPSPRSKDG